MFSLRIPSRFMDYSNNFSRVESHYFDKNNDAWVPLIDPANIKMIPEPFAQHDSIGVKAVNLCIKGKWRFRARDYTTREKGDLATYQSSWTEWQYLWIGKPEIEKPAGATVASLATNLSIKGFSLTPQKPKAGKKFDLTIELMK